MPSPPKYHICIFICKYPFFVVYVSTFVNVHVVVTNLLKSCPDAHQILINRIERPIDGMR